MSDEIVRDKEMSLTLTAPEALESVIKAVEHDYDVKEITGAKAWRYPDRWDVSVVAELNGSE